ncbi:hypothetical protein [Nocardia sp. AG03]|uniref:hypothetical protein n=1 Tax=Nocardia sp. AG03 TaxID=3025312 RepID=UPI0024185162|nr:hypothetical protein [Nocardia sp. AG03]
MSPDSGSGDIVVASTVQYGDRGVRVEIVDPRQDRTTHDWHCTYRVGAGRERKVRGPDRLAAVYAALLAIEDAANRAGPPDSAMEGRPSALVSAAHAREFGPPLGARAVHTASGPVVITLGRPRRDPNRSHTCLCPFRIDDRTEAFGQGFDDFHAVMSAIRGVGAILGIPGNWPGVDTRAGR